MGRPERAGVRLWHTWAKPAHTWQAGGVCTVTAFAVLAGVVSVGERDALHLCRQRGAAAGAATAALGLARCNVCGLSCRGGPHIQEVVATYRAECLQNFGWKKISSCYKR